MNLLTAHYWIAYEGFVTVLRFTKRSNTINFQKFFDMCCSVKQQLLHFLNNVDVNVNL